jgi:integrase
VWGHIRDTGERIIARQVRSKLENRTARLKLAARRKPYFVLLSPGISLGYRRNVTAGTWSVKASDGHGGAWLKGFAVADDHEDSNAGSVLSYWEAIDKARSLARAGDGSSNGDRPATVDEALTAYEADLKARGGDVANASRVRFNLSAGLLARPVGLLTPKLLRTWRDGLVTGGMTPSGAGRTTRVLAAALTLAAMNDERIINSLAWKSGLKRLPDSDQSRSGVILSDAVVGNIVSTAWELDPAYGLLIELSAITGARRSQLLRTTVHDLQDAGTAPRVMVPTSRKGRNRKSGLLALPISPRLARALRAAAAGRSDSDPLLVRTDGSPWPVADEMFRKVTASIGLDQGLTAYALRHSSIVRQILAGIPLRIVASSHDTSTAQIERNYSKHITGDPSDTICRRAMLDLAAPLPPNVVTLARA